MTRTQTDLILILRHAVCGGALPEGFSPADPEELYRVAHMHDLAHIAADVLLEGGLLDPESAAAERFAHDRSLAVWRVGVLEQEFRQICADLEDAHIDYLPLKGAVLRPLYPEPWMRTSADLDILVRREDLACAEDVLIRKRGYARGEAERHDHQMISPSGFHLELHFRLTEPGIPGAGGLQAVWDDAAALREGGYARRMSDERFYLYHVYHAAKHLRRASCGVRPVLDTWLILHSGRFDPVRCRALIAGSGLERFEDALVRIAEAWFSGAPLDSRYRDAEGLFFFGGVYPGAHNLAAAQATAGGGLRYALRRAFPPYDVLCRAYPALRAHRWLLPFCRAHRLCRAVFDHKTRVARRELRTLKHTRGRSRQLQELLAELGLTE